MSWASSDRARIDYRAPTGLVGSHRTNRNGYGNFRVVYVGHRNLGARHYIGHLRMGGQRIVWQQLPVHVPIHSGLGK